MRFITIIKARIKSISPLYIGDDDGQVLIDYDTNMAYLPATSVAGSFRSYLKTTGVHYELLFGAQEGEKSIMSSIYIRDSYSHIVSVERREGLKINNSMGTNESKHKKDMLILGKGLEFELYFEIHGYEERENEDNITLYKDMIYKCLNALDQNYIRLGSKKSSGFGNFKLLNVFEMNLDLSKFDDYKRYLKKNYDFSINILDKVKSTKLENTFASFIIQGEFSTPFIVKAPSSFEVGEEDNISLRSGNDYIVPGTSFKGILRARVEKIADYFGNRSMASEMFGEIKGEKGKQRLSRVIVNECKIINSMDKIYNRIKIDSFTGGVRKTSLLKDVPVLGKGNFYVMYKKYGIKEKDDYAIGILSLALKDLGMEDLIVGGDGSIGRGRFKAATITIRDNDNTINIDFENKKIEGEEILQKYIESVKKFREEDMLDEQKA